MKRWLRFPPPLHVVIPALVLACGLLALLVNGIVLLEWKLRRELEKQIDLATKHAQRVAVRVRSKLGGAEDRVLLQARIVGSYPDVNFVLVCDADGKIVQSSRKDWVGRTVQEASSPEAATLVARAIAQRQPAQFVRGRELFIIAHPVAPGPDSPVRYVVGVEVDLATPLAERREAAHREALLSAGVVCLASLLLWGLLYAFIRKRMRSIIGHIAIDHNGQPPLLPLSGSDEFAEISRILSRAEQVLKEVAENVLEVIWIITPEFKPVYLSSAFEKIWMRRREDIYVDADRLPEYTLKEYHSMLKEAFQAVFQGAPLLHVEYRIIRGDGQIRWIESRGFPVRDASGNVHRIAGISRDITDQKNLQ